MYFPLGEKIAKVNTAPATGQEEDRDVRPSHSHLSLIPRKFPKLNNPRGCGLHERSTGLGLVFQVI